MGLAPAPQAAAVPAAPGTRALVLDAAVAGLGALLVTVWFATASAVLPGLLALALAGALAFRIGAAPPRPPRPAPETLACLALAVVYRLPALIYPWGWVNRDGAYGAFVALHLLDGARPAPVFTEGANYQGTLKGHLAAALALLTGSRDMSWLLALSSLLLYLVFMGATLALARRLGGARPRWPAASIWP
jgi:hypothetical protein